MTEITWQITVLKYAEYVGTKGHYFYGSAGDPHDAPWPIDYFVWLLRCDDGSEPDIVIDVGYTAEVAARRGRTHLRTPAEALDLVGCDAATTATVILSHLHYDHVGDISAFPAASFVVQDREMAFWTGRYASRAEFRGVMEVEDVLALVRANYDRRLSFVDGDDEVAPGVSVHLVGGHSAGLQAIRVETRSGPVVLATDAAHFYANLDNDAPFAIMHDLAGMYGAFDRLRKLAGRRGIVVPGHDPLILQRFEPVRGAEGIAARIA